MLQKYDTWIHDTSQQRPTSIPTQENPPTQESKPVSPRSDAKVTPHSPPHLAKALIDRRLAQVTLGRRVHHVANLEALDGLVLR